MSLTSRVLWNTLIAGVLVAGGAFIWATRVPPPGERPLTAERPAARPELEPAPLPDHPAPDFTLTAADGSTVQLSALRGQVVLINVWATWCPPCRAEMPAIQSAYAEARDEGFTVLAVNMQEDAGTVASFMEEHGLTFPALMDTDGRVSAAYQARVVPSSFFVDRAGVIRAIYRGPLPRSAIAGTLDQLLKEAP